MSGANSLQSRPGTLPVLPAALALTGAIKFTASFPDGAGETLYDVPLSRLGGARAVAPTNGVAQVKTGTVVVSVAATAGTFNVTVTSALFSAPEVVAVTLISADDTAAEVATKIRAALTANAVVSAAFTIGGASAAVVLTAKLAKANDTTLNIAWPAVQGITALVTAASTTAGVLGTVPEYLGQLAISGSTVKAATDLSLNTWTTIS